MVWFFVLLPGHLLGQSTDYPWLQTAGEHTVRSLRVPSGFTRVAAPAGSFAEWIGRLPLKPAGQAVRLHSGAEKSNQNVHYRILDIDTGSRDLQQCADAVIRLWAEYLYARGRRNDIRFHFTSGHEAAYGRWQCGFRPIVRGSAVNWRQTARPDSSYRGFRAYLNTVFTYAGSYSLSRQLKSRQLSDVEIGDVFLQGGFPGHAVIVIDKAVSTQNGKTALLLAQSFMPAQDIHILKNPADPAQRPWYIIGATDKLYTPEWTFGWGDLYYLDVLLLCGE